MLDLWRRKTDSSGNSCIARHSVPTYLAADLTVDSDIIIPIHSAVFITKFHYSYAHSDFWLIFFAIYYYANLIIKFMYLLSVLSHNLGCLSWVRVLNYTIVNIYVIGMSPAWVKNTMFSELAIYQCILDAIWIKMQ